MVATKTSLIYNCELPAASDAPLFLLVHGRAGNQQVMWNFRRALPEGVNVVVPQAPIADPIGGFSWWLVPAPDFSASVISAAEELGFFLHYFLNERQLRPSKIVAFGFSQGAITLSAAMQLGLLGDRISGVAILSGLVAELPAEALKDVQGQGAKPAVFIAHGDQDEVIPVEQARRGAEFLEARGYGVNLQIEAVGHKVGSASFRALKEWSSNTLK